jgi:hypothetical protein
MKKEFFTTDSLEQRSRNRTQTFNPFIEGNEGNKGRGDQRLFVPFVAFCSNSVVWKCTQENGMFRHSSTVDADTRSAFIRSIRVIRGQPDWRVW